MTQEEKLEEELTGKQSKAAAAGILAEPAASIIHLPSKGILYRNDPNLSEVHDGSISARPMTMRELELFMRPELLESGTLIDAILKKCIKSNIDPKYLLTSDRTYLLIYLRSLSFGPDYRFEFKCGGCRRNISHKINMGSLPIKTLDEIHGELDKGKLVVSSVKKIKEPFAYQLPHSKLTVLFRLSRGSDEAEKSRDQYFNKVKSEQNRAIHRNKDGRLVIRNVDPNEQTEEESGTHFSGQPQQTSILENVMKQVVSIEGVPDDMIEQALGNMLAGDVTSLQEAMYESDSGIEMRIEVPCPDQSGCRTDNKITVPFTESFFRSSL